MAVSLIWQQIQIDEQTLQTRKSHTSLSQIQFLIHILFRAREPHPPNKPFQKHIYLPAFIFIPDINKAGSLKSKDTDKRRGGLVSDRLSIWFQPGFWHLGKRMEGKVVDDIIRRLLDYKKNKASKQVPLMETEIRQLCAAAREILLRQPILLELEAPIKICGTISLSLNRFMFKYVVSCWEILVW